MTRTLATFVALLLPAIAVNAQTVTVQIPCSADNTLYEDAAGALSNGFGQFVFVGKNSSGLARRALLSFDVASVIPTRSRIMSAQVSLGVTQTTATTPTLAKLHRVGAAWGESASLAPGAEGGGGAALSGDATWLHAQYPGTFWTTPGGDYVATPSSSADMPLVGPFTFPSSEQMTGDVQDWLDGQPNHGWLVRTDEVLNSTARKIASRQNASLTTVLPTLTVTYLPPGNVASVGSGCATSANQNLTQTVQGPIVQGGVATLTVQSGVPLGLFVTLLSFDLRGDAAEPEPGCFWYLRPFPHPNLGIKIQDLNGDLTESYSIPVDSALFGIPIAMQSILVDWAHPRQWAVSNANLICIQ